tara:strand:+ start:338 stop:499 length:162 start_codon:yes stop_codon:yes gene_type:complete
MIHRVPKIIKPFNLADYHPSSFNGYYTDMALFNNTVRAAKLRSQIKIERLYLD